MSLDLTDDKSTLVQVRASKFQKSNTVLSMGADVTYVTAGGILCFIVIHCVLSEGQLGRQLVYKWKIIPKMQ